MFNPGKIQVKEGTWSDTCTLDSDLVANQMKYPAIRKILEHADERMLSTLLVSGAVNPYGGVGFVETKIGKVDDSKSIGDNAYRFEIQGRIQKASRIIAQIGATNADGSFTLQLADNYLFEGMNVLFHGQGFQARLMSPLTGSAGNYIGNFQSADGALFVWATHVAPQGTTYTCFGGNTSYGEKSLKGYGRSHFADAYINHMTIQRSTVAISGSAASDVLWIEYDNGPDGKAMGWMYAEMQQQDARFRQEDEFQKWKGISSMKDSSGNLLAVSRLTDTTTGLPIITGDGILEQIGGVNETSGSGVNGFATADDFSDMMTTIRKKSDKVTGLTHVVVTGEDGYANAQEQMALLAGNQNIQIQQTVVQSSNPGGAMVDIGFHYSSFNINGDKIVFVKHPMWDDEERFTERSSDGRLKQSGMYVFLTTQIKGKNNLEILSKGANGVNRSNVTQFLNGLSGADRGPVVSEEDAIKYAILKENMINAYKTDICGIINKA